MHANERRYRILWLVLVASLAFNAGVGAAVGVRAYNSYTEHATSEGRSKPQRELRILDHLDLTEDQRAELHAAREELHAKHQELRAAIRAETDVLADALQSTQPDRDAIDLQIRRLGELREQMDRDLVDHFIDIRLMLSPDQHEAFDEVIRHALHRGGKGHRRPGGPRGLHRGPEKEFGKMRHPGDDASPAPPEKETE